MYVCICMCMYMYMHMHMYICTYVFVCVCQIQLCVYMLDLMCTSIFLGRLTSKLSSINSDSFDDQ